MTAIVAAFVLTAGLVADATVGRLVAGARDRRFAAVTIDSRSLPADALFIALAGPRFDGHQFVSDVLARGAAGVVVSSVPDQVRGVGGTPAAVIVVDDTLAALQRLGRDVRVRSGARVVAITGSAGKTTTKEATASFLSARFTVFRNAGNLNNHIGLPLSLVELRHGAEIGIVELGMNHAGEIRTLVRLARPEVRVWINVGDAHIGFFGTRDAIAAAKAEILEEADAASVLVANADDPLVMGYAHRFAGRVVTFGESERADVRALHVVARGFDGTSCDVHAAERQFPLEVALAGRAQLSNVLASVAVALEFGVPPSELTRRAAALRPVARRGDVLALPSGVRLVDDSYNASPAATRAMLEALGDTRAAGRRVAVLGEMLELGDDAYALHRECGEAAASRVDELVVIGGPVADGLAAGAMARGMDPTRVQRFSSSEEAARKIADLVGAGDLVLVKGSRGTRTDLVADRLKEA